MPRDSRKLTIRIAPDQRKAHPGPPWLEIISVKDSVAKVIRLNYRDVTRLQAVVDSYLETVSSGSW